MFWLPQMEQNAYKVIAFQDTVYTESARLEATPAPDTVIRVFMAYMRSDVYVDIEAQALSAPQREGFTLVEWGGTQVQ